MNGAKHRFSLILTCLLLTGLTVVYPFLLYTDNAFVTKWREWYIETAMGTMTHQWLATSFIPHDVHVAVEQSVLEHIVLRNGRLFIEDHVADRLFLVGRENVHSLTGGADHGARKTRRRHGEVSLGVGEPAVERVWLLSAFRQEKGIIFQPFDRIVFGRYDDLSGLHVDDSVVMA